MKYLLSTVAALGLATSVAATEYDSMNPITVGKVEAQLDAIENLMDTLDLDNLERMVDYIETEIEHYNIIPGSLAFGTELDLTYPELDLREYTELSYDAMEFTDARADFIEDIHQFFVASDDGSIDFILYNTNEGVLGGVANQIVDEWDAMHVHISNLEHDPTSLHHWTQVQAHAAAIHQLEMRYNYIYKSYVDLAEAVISWGEDDLIEYIDMINEDAKEEALK